MNFHTRTSGILKQLTYENSKFAIIVFVLFGTLLSSNLLTGDGLVSSNIMPELFHSNIYRVAEHVHSVDESVVTNHYYSKFVKGYDAIFFALQSNHLTDHDIEDAGFESAIPLAYWSLDKKGSFLAGYPIVERSGNQKYTGNYSLHLKSSSANNTENPSYAGVSQQLTHPSPLSSNLNVSYKIFPVRLTSPTSAIDSQIQIRFNLLHWNSSDTFPTIAFVYTDEPIKEFENNFANNTNTVYILRKALFNSWNDVTENLTQITESYWGEEFARDQAVQKTELRVISSNNGIAETYLDHLRKNVTQSNSDVYRIQEEQIAHWSTPELRLYPGEELNGVSNLFSLNVPSSKFIESARGPNGPIVDLNKLHNLGLYAGLAHPFQNESQLNWALNSSYNVDMVDIYGNKGCLYEPDTRVWDHYLEKGIFAMATATPNVHAPIGVERMNTEGYAMHIFSNSSNADDLLENMAMGRSFIQTMTASTSKENTTFETGPPMSLYFTTARDQVPMGRYPIIVDPSTKVMDLHIIVTNIPSSISHANLVIKSGGKPIHDPVPINGGTMKFDRIFSVPLSFDDDHTYFRYEIQDAISGKALAFSQPLIFIKKSLPIFPGFWTALVPKNSAALDLDEDSISFEDNMLKEKVKVRVPQKEQNQVATVKIFIPKGLFKGDNFTVSVAPHSGSMFNYSFNNVERILTVNTVIENEYPATITVKAGNSTTIKKSALPEKNTSPSSWLINIGNKQEINSTYDPNETPRNTNKNATEKNAVKMTAPNPPVIIISNSSISNQEISNDVNSPSQTANGDNASILYHYEPFFELNGTESSTIADDKNDDTSFKLTNFSLAAWFRTDMDVPMGCNVFIVNKGGIGSNEVGENMNYGVWMTPSKKIQAGFESQQGGTKYFVISPKQYDDNKWHYVVVTFDGSMIRLYIDGLEIANKTTDGLTPDNGSLKPVRIGANSFRSDNGLFMGDLDEIRIWNRSITEKEVIDAYRQSKFDASGQIAHLPFG
ncbi:MAG: LamG domain-containing protein [Thermoproteota archaeon]|nr:LamG domain-containing protein [Thermoproteota archaeon]